MKCFKLSAAQLASLTKFIEFYGVSVDASTKKLLQHVQSWKANIGQQGKALQRALVADGWSLQEENAYWITLHHPTIKGAQAVIYLHHKAHNQVSDCVILSQDNPNQYHH